MGMLVTMGHGHPVITDGKGATMITNQRNPQNIVFQALDNVPGQFWYLCGIGTIATSLALQLAGQKNWADFVGKWPPTFFAIGLYHKLIRPGNEDATGAMQQANQRVQKAAQQVGL
jgi:hypothetical protein